MADENHVERCPRCGGSRNHWYPPGARLGHYLCDPPIKVDGLTYPREPTDHAAER